MLPREDIAQAIFGLLAPLGVGSPPLVKTLSRAIIPAAQAEPSNCPAIYQVQPQTRPMANTRTLEGLFAKIIVFEWFVYVFQPESGNTPASAIMNPILDAVEGVLPPAGVPFVVDGVACPLYWDGTIDTMEAIIQNMSVSRIEVLACIPPADPA